MKKKILSCMLAVAMVASLATATTLTTSAEDTATRGTIYFDSTNLYGATSDGSKNMYCYTWSRTEGEMYGWDTKGCKMTNVGEHLYSYDVPSVNSAGVEVNADLMVFHASGGLQTWEITFDDSCMGDTAYVYGDLYGMYPTNSTAGMPACEWKNNPTHGTHITINSSGEVLGWSLLTSETPESVVDTFIDNYRANMEAGKTGYDNPELVTDENRTALIAEINAIIDSRAVEDPTEVPTEETTDLPAGDITVKKGLPVVDGMEIPERYSSEFEIYGGEVPADWDGYYNVYYFEAPESWVTENVDKKVDGYEIGFYWYGFSTTEDMIYNAEFPGLPAEKLSVFDENGNDIYADSNIYYAFVPTFASRLIWNNAIANDVENYGEYHYQTEIINIDDPMVNNLANLYYEKDTSIDGVNIAGGLVYTTGEYFSTSGLTGDPYEDHYLYAYFKFFDPATAQTTTEVLKDENGNYVTKSDAKWGYDKVALNPYYDMDYTYVNSTEEPTTAPTEKVTDAPTSSATTATSATSATSATTATVKATATTSTNTSNGTVNTSQSSAVGTLALVFTASLGVVFVANKKRENNN